MLPSIIRKSDTDGPMMTLVSNDLQGLESSLLGYRGAICYEQPWREEIKLVH